MENTTKENPIERFRNILTPYVNLVELMAMPETTEIIQMIERTNLLCRESNSKVHHYLTEVETRLTQFEEMKTALEKIASIKHIDAGYEECQDIAKEALASLSETNEKP